ncbi:ABC transporter permease [Flavitalea sp. BT771]|uniref:ABC transporter permease n=1 Tax=Flavitalea sp. BT771 TaxID=3063329 RepID=UPI0026E3766E|nr:ABC transporter permease [Flavitalea sp. BT771]MDO6432901.1 ABC transporter permease [Flavitalea sp. BT771]MDV6221823.1 ABC transporter permease [Flavitalea sp. BT771]
MFKNYFNIALRGLKKSLLFSVINMGGLSLGLACSMLILLYVKDEWSYDQFHEKKHRIFQLTCERSGKDGRHEKFAISAMVQGPAFKEAVPEMEAFVRVDPQQLTIRKDNQVYTESATWVDDNFFSIFSFPLVAGSPAAVLSDPHSLVVTEQMAKKYFNNGEAIGKTLDMEINGQFEPFTITGIAKTPPPNSTIGFNVLLPFKYLAQTSPDNGWMWVSYPTYFLLRPGANLENVKRKMDAVYRLQAKDEIDMDHRAGYDDTFTWDLMPFTKMHLNTEYAGTPASSNPLYTYILTGIALFILLIACINFINLTLARSLKRSKEIGIRKIIGGVRAQLMIQFLGESFLLCSFSFLLAAGLAGLALPFFNSLVNKHLSLDYLLDLPLTAAFFSLLLLTGLLAGCYPAFVLSGFNPVRTLSDRSGHGFRNYLARSLVVLQFSLAAFLIIATFFMYAQFNFLTKADLGYQDKNLVEFISGKAIMNKPLMDLLRSELSKVPGVESAGYSNIGKFGGKTQAGGKEFTASYQRVDENYLTALQVSFVSGRNFSRAFPSDSLHAVLVNESFIKAAGWKEGVGKTIDCMNIPDWGDKKTAIVGVVKDYHAESLREKIKPTVFTMDAHLPMGRVTVRIRSKSIPATIAALEKAYHVLIPEEPFQYSFKDDLNRKYYDSDAKWQQIISFGALLTVLISCVGLFGLTLLSAERRAREIGIRKALGASSWQIVRLISGDLMQLVSIALILAIPVSLLAVHRWLGNFAYRIDISWWMFGLAGVLTLMTALLTIGVQSIKASRANPAVVLRTE